MADEKTPAKPGARDKGEDKAEKVVVRFLRTHYRAGVLTPCNIGDREEVSAEEAKSFVSYDIAEIVPSLDGVVSRLPEREALVRIEQLLSGADAGDKEAVAALQALCDQEFKAGRARPPIVKLLRSAKGITVPADDER